MKRLEHLAWKLRLGAEILSTYVRVRLTFRERSLPETIEALRLSRATAQKHEVQTFEDSLLGLRLGHAVSRSLGLLPFDSRCLVRSLVLTQLLDRRGISSRLVIGVRSSPSFAAHAWVESGGVPLLPSEERDFQRLVEL